MSRKSDLKKAIQESEEEIETLEKKRIRSQSALLEAFLNHTEPSEADSEYFRVFTSLIELERENLRRLSKELSELEGNEE
ncbi:hypothetical protein [Pumilibacter intestinalis]|uniref:hypothetical protein n=1 Tax=Pumilibacter intestinalis TaxID=2941511 RepID=UPI002040DE7A|nr:hypothetical protein [Pumilibacter intestinalis]MCI8488221.1 hypothetical protein [Clostridia bacterium]